MNMKYAKYFLFALGLIILDQAVKMLVHFTMQQGLPGEIKVLGDWFKIHYTLNPGMAFGLQLGSVYGKLLLTSFRILAMGAIVYYLYTLIKTGAAEGLRWCVAGILAGAIGNLIDSVFYGIWLNNTPYDAPMALFHGQVIDMFYLDIWEGIVPEWFPVLGGQYYSLWPIFNVADSCIFLGVMFILIYQKSFFPEIKNDTSESENAVGKEGVI